VLCVFLYIRKKPGLDPSPPVLAAHMGLDPTLWRFICDDVMEFVSGRPPLRGVYESKQTMVILSGLPGSGKVCWFVSSFFLRFEIWLVQTSLCEAISAAGLPVVRINQDKLGTRQKCLDVCEKALKAGKSVVVIVLSFFFLFFSPLNAPQRLIAAI